MTLIKDDRIQRAWELRAAIHAWLRDHEDAVMAMFYEAFPLHQRDNIRQTVARMRKDGMISMAGTWGQQVCTYRAIGDSIPTADERRAKMAAGGSSTIRIAIEARQKGISKKAMAKIVAQRNRDERAAKKAAEEAAKAEKSCEQVIGGKFVYREGDNPDITRFKKEGQGSVGRAPIGSGMYGNGGNW